MLAAIIFSITVMEVLPSSGEELHTDLIARSISALNKAALYYQRQYSELNVDGLSGLRFAEGHIESVLSTHGQELERDGHRAPLEKLHLILHTTSKLAIIKNKVHGDEYYKMFRRVIEEPWYYQARTQKYQDDLVAPVVSRGNNFNEETSDECMSGLLGSQEVGPQKPCDVTDKCWKLMTGKGTGGYALTHQILYFLLAEKTGCRDSIKKERNIDFYKLFPYLGSNVYSQMHKNPKRSSYHKDLFLEQGLMCDWLGINKCVTIEWTEEILQWQDQSGCIISEKEQPKVIAKKAKGSSRRLNVEVILDNGCSTHMSSLFLAYLAASMHWLVRNNIPLNSQLTIMEQYIKYIKVAVIVVAIIWIVFLTRMKRLLRGCLFYFYVNKGKEELV